MKLQTNRGFTLVEIMASLGIFLVVTLIVFVGNGRFNNTILLTNLAYDVALTAERAQSYGVSVKQFGTGTESFNVGYGVHFRLCGTTADSQESDDISFVLFADANRDHYYEKSASPTEFLERYIIRRGNKINKLYAINSSNVATEVSGLDVTFLRPDPDAFFAFFDCSGTPVSLSSIRAVRVEVISPAGITKNINIATTGQISVQ